MSPPEKIPVGFIYDLASPQGIELSDIATATTKLLSAKHPIYEVRVDEQGWASFWYDLDSASPLFSHAVASSTAGPDFHEGFAFPEKSIGNKELSGLIIYFDTALTSCDNVLFSKHPLDSASFAMIVCNPEASRHNGGGDSLTVFYCRKGSAVYRKLTR